MSEYHSTDFSFDEWAKECAIKCSLPEIVPYIEDHKENNGPVKHWDEFFVSHNSGNFFKPRRYLALEFAKYFDSNSCKTVLEVGCGHGCSMYPLLEVFPSMKYIATDYSAPALSILRTHSFYDEERVPIVAQWDVTCPPPIELQDAMCSVILCVFALSAVHPKYHKQCFLNMKQILTTNTESGDKVILFRDYAIHDMTMYRHTTRFEENLYQRTDGTLSYYFDLDYLRSLCNDVGFDVLELEYATVENKNRKKESVMRRVFVHAVFCVK